MEENRLKLNGELCFAIKQHEKRLRLVVYKQGDEYVCRQEARSKLESFLATDELRIFKGRLQLWKKSTNIFVEVKGKIAGTLQAEDFKKLIQNS